MFFFILFVAAIFPFLIGDQNKLQHVYLTFQHPWQMVFPILLLLSFIILLILCAVKKYQEQELNWLLVVNTIVLVVYLAAIFVRLQPMLH